MVILKIFGPNGSVLNNRFLLFSYYYHTIIKKNEKSTMNNRVILITGSRKGIGKYLSKYYTSKGFFVEGCSRNTPEWQLENYTHHEINVSNEKQVRQMLSSIRKRHK